MEDEFGVPSIWMKEVKKLWKSYNEVLVFFGHKPYTFLEFIDSLPND